MAVVLQKPLGTDIYDIDVFNSNFTIIEKYLNQLVFDASSGLKVYYYPETSETFNVDTATTGIHICNNLDVANLLGTYPGDNTKWYFEVLSFISETSVSVQLYVDMTEGHNRLYIRSKLPNAEWTGWTGTGSSSGGGGGGGGGGTTSGITVMYVSSLDLDTVDTGIFMCDGAALTGTLPDKLGSTAQIQLICYGSGNDAIKTQVLTDVANGNDKMFTRVQYRTESGQFAWSTWVAADSGSGSDISISIVTFDD